MTWARIDDAFDDHPKVLAVLEHDQGGAAIGLWTLCLTWAHRNTLRKNKTPGQLPASLPRRYLGPGARELAGILVKEGLWEPLDDGDGWQIHDFDRYLPTEKTSQARAEAGRKGAASRWGQRGSDGTEPGTDSNLPSTDGNGLEPGHDVDGNQMAADGNVVPPGSPGRPAGERQPNLGLVHGNESSPNGNLPSGSQEAMANDGSRAPVRRAISNEIAFPDPIPVPPTAAHSAATAGTLVAEWIRACRKRPPDRVIGAISRDLKVLLDEDHDVADIREGLERWRLAGKNPSSLASFVNEVMNSGSTNGTPVNGAAVDHRQQAHQAQFGRAMERAAAREGKLTA